MKESKQQVCSYEPTKQSFGNAYKKPYLQINMQHHSKSNFQFVAAGVEPNMPYSIGRRTCLNPDNPGKRAVFPEGDNPNGIAALISEFRMSRREAVALLGRWIEQRQNKTKRIFSLQICIDSASFTDCHRLKLKCISLIY